MADESDVVELPPIPDDAPEWVRALPANGRFVDRNKYYDITGHLIFDSLLNLNGIRHFFYFMTSDKQVERVLKAVKGIPLSPGADDELTGKDKAEVQVAFHLGEGICGHKGIVHGGLTATMLDEVSGAAAYSCYGPCFTANLTVDYIRPLLTPAWVLVRAHVHRHDGRKVSVHSTVENGEGVVYAKGVSLFVKPREAITESLHKN